jgi:hypothetical protein
MPAIKVGHPYKIKGKEYLCVRITCREETYLANADSASIKYAQQLQPRSGALTVKFECDDFKKGDVITEKLEEVRFTAILCPEPLVIKNYHTYKKEEDNGDEGIKAAIAAEAKSAEPQAIGQRYEDQTGLRESVSGEDSDAPHDTGRVSEARAVDPEQGGAHSETLDGDCDSAGGPMAEPLSGSGSDGLL